jgi:hypothetical protein
MTRYASATWGILVIRSGEETVIGGQSPPTPAGPAACWR